MFCRFNVRSGARAFAAPICGILLLVSAAGPVLAQQTLTLADAISRAVSADPTVGVNTARLDAASASLRQAGVGPRPTVGVDVEDFTGTRPYSGFKRSESTAFYQQTWERGDKRGARIGVAQAEVEVARQRASVRMLDLIAKVQGAWIDAAAAEAAITIAEERVAIAERLDREVRRRVARALDPLFAGERAKANLAQALTARDQAIETARIARRSLASWWGGAENFKVDPQELSLLKPVASSNGLNPDLALVTAEREVADASVRLAESSNFADPTFRIGVRHNQSENGIAVIVGGAIPIGVESANRSNIDRAAALRRAADAELAVSRLDVRRETERLIADRARITSEVTRIDGEILPTAERAARLVVDGYTRGGTAFTYLEMADAQRAVIDAHTRKLDLLRQFNQDGVRLDRLSGRYIAVLPGQEVKQ